MLYVTLEGLSGGVLNAAIGGSAGKWSNKKIVTDTFDYRRRDADIHDGHLRTEAEAREIAKSMGLPDIDAIKTEMIDNFTKVNRYPPNIVTENPDTIIARRKKGIKEAKWRGWDL